MKIQATKERAEMLIGGRWVLIQESLAFSEHVSNARKLGATEVRSLSHAAHVFLA